MSKQPAFRKFRRSLAEFFERLIQSAAEMGLLYDTELMPTLQGWVVAMSSAHMRSFRHTATVIALEVESAIAGMFICDGVDKLTVGEFHLQRRGVYSSVAGTSRSAMG